MDLLIHSDDMSGYFPLARMATTSTVTCVIRGTPLANKALGLVPALRTHITAASSLHQDRAHKDEGQRRNRGAPSGWGLLGPVRGWLFSRAGGNLLTVELGTKVI